MQSSTPDPGDANDADAVEHDVTDDVIDLAAIESDLDGVQAALARLADGTYWTDEVSGGPIPDEVLAGAPLTRRA